MVQRIIKIGLLCLLLWPQGTLASELDELLGALTQGFEDGDLFYEIQEVVDREHLIDVSEDLRHFRVFRKRDFYAKAFVTSVVTVEERHGWPYIAEVALALSQRDEVKKLNGVPEFRDIFDPELAKIWTQKRGWKNFQRRFPQFSKLLKLELQRQQADGNTLHEEVLSPLRDFTVESYRHDRDWTDELENYLSRTIIDDRHRSAYGWVSERLYSRGPRSKETGKMLGSIMKTTSHYARFLVRRKSRRIGENGWREVVCQAGFCDPGNFLRPDGKEVKGLTLFPPDSLVVEDLHQVRLPRMANPTFNLDGQIVRLNEKDYEIKFAGMGSVSEDRCFVVAHTRDRDVYRKAIGSAWVNLQFFMGDPEAPRKSQQFHRTYAYMPRDGGERSKSWQLYEGLGLLDEVYPESEIVWPNGKREFSTIFSWGPDNMAELVRNPSKFRKAFQDVDPNFLVKQYIMLLEYERRHRRPYEGVKGRRIFMTSRRIRKYFAYVISQLEKVPKTATEFSQSEEVTQILRGIPKLVAAEPTIRAETFWLYVRKEYSKNLPFRSQQGYRLALEDVGAYKDQNLTEEETLLAFRNIAYHYLDQVSMKIAEFTNPEYEEIVRHAIFEATGKKVSPVAFQHFVSKANEEGTGWYGFFPRALLDPGKYREAVEYSRLEVERVVLGAIERRGKFILGAYHNKENRAFLEKVMKDVLPERRKHLRSYSRFRTALVKLGGAKQLAAEIPERISLAERNFANDKITTFQKDRRLTMLIEHHRPYRKDKKLAAGGKRTTKQAVQVYFAENPQYDAVGLVIWEKLIEGNEMIAPHACMNDPACLAELVDAAKDASIEISVEKMKGILNGINRVFLRYCGLGTAKWGRTSILSPQRFRFMLKDLHEQGILAQIVEEKGSLASHMGTSPHITSYLRDYPAVGSKPTAKGFYRFIWENYASHVEDQRYIGQTVQAALIDAGVDWRPYFPGRDLELFEVVKIIRYLKTHHADEIRFTPQGIGDIDPDLLNEAAWQAVKARLSPDSFLYRCYKTAGGVFQAVFYAGFDPGEDGFRAGGFEPKERDYMVRELMASLGEFAGEYSSYKTGDAILKHLLKRKLMARDIFHDSSLMQELVQAVSKELEREVSTVEIRRVLKGFDHRVSARPPKWKCIEMVAEAAA